MILHFSFDWYAIVVNRTSMFMLMFMIVLILVLLAIPAFAYVLGFSAGTTSDGRFLFAAVRKMMAILVLVICKVTFCCLID